MTNLENTQTGSMPSAPKGFMIFSVVAPTSGRTYKLHKERIVVGSVVSADVHLMGEDVSPIHAVIELNVEDGGLTATAYDLASDTGVYINGQKIITNVLKTGDELLIGQFRIKFAIEPFKPAVASQLPNKAPAGFEQTTGGSKLPGGAPFTVERYREAEGRKLFLNPNEDLTPLLLEDEREVVEIFDYRPTQKQALEVVMSWKSTILDIEHFVTERSVTIGAKRDANFGIPPLLSSSRYAIVKRQGEEFVLQIDSQMKGVIQSKGQLKSVDQVRSVASGTSSVQVVLGRNDFAKLSVGDVDFYLSYTAAPPKLKANNLFERDAFLFKILMASLVLTAATIGTLLSMPVPQNIEAEKLPDRIATILYKPEQFTSLKKPEPPKPEPKQKEVAKSTPPPAPAKKEPVQEKKVVKLDIKPKQTEKKPVPKEMNVAQATKPSEKASSATRNQQKASNRAESEAKEGEGARAQGREGQRGSKKAAPGNTSQNMAKRPSPMGGTGRGGGNSQVQDQGNVDLLKGASSKIQNLLGNTAAQLGAGGQKLEGFGGFNTMGRGGLGMAGDGKGGGGDAASLGGLSNKGRGGGRVGTGMGAAGNGSGIIGGKARVEIRSGGPEEAVVMGVIDADAVEAALLAHKDEFRLCYEREINAENPNLAGRVSTSFVIGPSGRVTQAGIESTSLKHPNVERCVLQVIRRIDFPIPRGAGVVQVRYPFKFSSGK